MIDWRTPSLPLVAVAMFASATAILFTSSIPVYPVPLPTLETPEGNSVFKAIDEGKLDDSDPMAQVNSVSQLSDVQPTDWAFSALQSLIERYGCISGYPNGTFRGNSSLTRYEFAAGLNACLDRIGELIATASTNLLRQDDILILQRLQGEFAAELATLRGRIDSLEARTAELETNRFSSSKRPQGFFSFGASSRLLGEAIFSVSDVFSGEGDDEAIFQQRLRFVLLTSFTGDDLLFFRFVNVNNGITPNLAGGTREGTLASQYFGGNTNIVFAGFLEYIFPVGEKLHVHVAANFGYSYLITSNSLNPYLDNFEGGSGALTIFGQRNPIYRLGGGSGFGFHYRFNDNVALTGGYLGGEAGNPSPGSGLFNGNYTTWGQITWTPNDSFGISFLYNNAYFDRSTFTFGDNSGVLGIRGFTGTAVVEDFLAPFQVVSNSYGGQASWRINPKLTISGWVGLTKVRALGQGDGDIWNYAITVALPDLGKQGNLGGLVVGVEPYLTSLEGVKIPSNATSVHVEAFYKYQLTNNISITPGIIWITAPNQNHDNEDIVIGTVRTTFLF